MELQEACSSIPLVGLAKFNQPWLPIAFPRERLFKELDALADRPGLWIGAPGGYGKTTLAASYIKARGVTHLWYRIDEDDADPATFFYYLSLAADTHGTGPPLPLLTPECQSDMSAFARRFFRSLLQRFVPPYILIFDNYHCLPVQAPLHALLAEMLDLLPTSARCLITSRGEPPPELARARLHGQLAIIESEALQLTLPEAEGIAAIQSERRLLANEIHLLNERVQGWAAGLILLLRYVGLDRPLPLQATAEQVFDYFAAEVWSQVDPALQTFLLKTAFLPTMTAAMARDLTGDEQADERLNALVRRHSFVFRSENVAANGDAWTITYQYHDLLRDFLLSSSRETFGAAEREQIQRRTAEILETAGKFEAAIEIRRSLRDWDYLSRLVNQYAESLLQQGRGRLLESWLADFPPAFRNASPWLLFWLGQCRLPRDPVTARTTLARAYRRFKHVGDVTGLWLSWSAITDTFSLAWDNFHPASGWLVEFERLRVRYPSFPSLALEARVGCGALSLMLYAQPDHPQFQIWEQRIIQLSRTDCPPSLYLIPLNTLLLHYIWNVGRHGKAAWVLDILRTIYTDTSRVEPALRCAQYWGEFCYQYWYQGDLKQCLAIAEDGWATAAQYEVSLFNSFTLSSFVYAHLSAGQVEAGRTALERYQPILKSLRPLERLVYDYLRGWEAWLSGRLPEALERLEQGLHVARRSFYSYTGIGHWGLAQVQASLGHRSAALRHLSSMRLWIRATDSQIGTFVRALSLAQFALAWGRQKTRRLRLLRRALVLGRMEGYIFFPFFKPDDVAYLCAVALDADIEVEYVQTLIRKRGLQPDPSMVISDRWPWPVKIYTLGYFELVIEDQPVRFGRKAQRKPLELLKLLIAWGGRGVSQTQIADVLWPDADGDAGQRSLTTTLHRLRRLLGCESAVSVQDGRLSLDPRYCWVDVWYLERRISQALTRMGKANRSNAALNDLTIETEALLQAYRGPFLDLDPEPWVYQARDRLQERYRKGLEKIGRHWEAHGEQAMASACFEQILEVKRQQNTVFRVEVLQKYGVACRFSNE